MPDMNMQTFEELQRHQLVTEFDIQSQSELEDYQVKLDNVDNPTQAQDNLVVGSDGESLPNWNETVDFDTWIKMRIEAGGKRGLLIHGNEGLYSVSDGDEVFIQWHGGAAASFHDSNVATVPFIYEASGRRTSDSPTDQINFGLSEVQNVYGDDSVIIYNTDSGTNFNVRVYNNGASSVASNLDNTWVLNQYYHLKIIAASSSDVKFYFEDIEQEQLTTNVPDEAIGLVFYEFSGSGEQEWSFARKYTGIEPTHTIGTPKNISTALKSFGRAG